MSNKGEGDIFLDLSKPHTNTPLDHEGPETNLEAPEPESNFREGGECEASNVSAVELEAKSSARQKEDVRRLQFCGFRVKLYSQDELRTAASVAACSRRTNVPRSYEHYVVCIHT
jgi:hypothetical protein